MNQTIQFIPQINNTLNHFKTYIDTLIKQNNKCSNKNLHFKQTKIKTEKLLDQLEVIDKRIE